MQLLILCTSRIDEKTDEQKNVQQWKKIYAIYQEATKSTWLGCHSVQERIRCDLWLKSAFLEIWSQDVSSSCFPPTLEFFNLDSAKERLLK